MAEKLNSLSPSSQVTLGLMISLLTILGGSIWQFATMSGRINYLEEKLRYVEENTTRKDVITLELNAIRQQLTAQNETLVNIQQALAPKAGK